MGTWVPISCALYNMEIHRCSFCGGMITKQFWQIEEQGRRFKFCDSECERLWYDYWLPRYGERIRMAPGKGTQ